LIQIYVGETTESFIVSKKMPPLTTFVPPARCMSFAGGASRKRKAEIEAGRWSFAGGSSRKRRAEIEAQMHGQDTRDQGLYSHECSPPRRASPPQHGPRPPSHPPPQFAACACGAQFPPNMRFCVQCGTKRPVMPPASQPARRDVSKSRAESCHGPVDVPQHPGRQAKALWLTLPDDSTLVREGLPASAPALKFDSAHKELFSIAASTLTELLGDDASGMEMIDDSEGAFFPELAAALDRAGCSKEERFICIALSEKLQRFGVGIAGNKKNRERAAKLALAVALAQHSSRMAGLAPEFCELCRTDRA